MSLAENEIQRAWHDNADALAVWTETRVVNRTDAHGRYAADGSVYTVTPDRGQLVDRQLIRGHFLATDHRGVLGFHSIGTDDTCKSPLADIDAHSAEINPEIVERNERFAIASFNKATKCGMSCLLTDSNGRGGFHLRALFATPIPSALAERVGEWLVSDWKEFGFTERPESFPKSATHFTQSGRNLGGGWARGPGLHPKRLVWPKVWDGFKFVAGADAVKIILDTVGGDPSLIPNEVKTFKTAREIREEENKQRADEANREFLSKPRPSASGLVSPLEVARGICHREPGWIPRPTGQSGRENACFKLMCWIIRGTGLSAAEAAAVVSAEWNHRACDMNGKPMPFTETELAKKTADAVAAVSRDGGPTLNDLLWAEARASGDYSKIYPKSNGAIPQDDDEGFIETQNRTPPEDTRPVVELSVIREEMRTVRESIMDRPGLYSDLGGTGVGKSHADELMAIDAAKRGKKVAFLTPSHALGIQALGNFQANPDSAGLDIVLIQPRTTPKRAESSPEQTVNCWNDDADTAESIGIPAIAICEFCPERARCITSGHLGLKFAANKSQIMLATTQRANLEGFTSLCDGRDLIISHEGAVDVLQPFKNFRLEDVVKLRTVFHETLNNPENSKNYFEKFGISPETAATRKAQRQLLESILLFVDWLLLTTKDSTESATINRTWTAEVVKGVFWPLWRTLRGDWSGDIPPSQDLNTPAMSGLFGYLQQHDLTRPRLMLQVDSIKPVGAEERHVKSFTTTWRNLPPDGSVSIFSDGTAEFSQLEAITKPRTIIDITPAGRIETCHRIVQHVDDITAQTSPNVAANLVRSILQAQPEINRLGVVCLSKHKPEIEKVRVESGRIANITHFWSGVDAGSNRWIQPEHRGGWECDELLIIGTPRPNQSSVRRRLFQINDAAVNLKSNAAGWGEYVWSGKTESGESVDVRTRGYRNEAWQRAYQSLTWATIRQAIGRARITIRDQGIPVFVVSREPLGIPLFKAGGIPILSKGHSDVLKVIRNASGEKITTKQIAVVVGQQECRARLLAVDLEGWGYVNRIGKRGGWKMAPEFNATFPYENLIGKSSDAQKAISSISVPELHEIEAQIRNAQETIINSDEFDLSEFVDAFEPSNALAT